MIELVILENMERAVLFFTQGVQGSYLPLPTLQGGDSFTYPPVDPPVE